MGRFRVNRNLEGHSLHTGIAVSQQVVSAVLDPLGHIGVGRPAIGRVVLEPAILRRVVRGSDDNAVGESVAAGAVVNEYGTRDDRRWREPLVSLDYRLYVICCEDFECCALSWPGKRMRVFAHVKRAIGCLRAPIIANGLGDREDVRLGERAVEGRSPVPAGAEADSLRGMIKIRPAFEILLFEAGQIDQHLLRCRLAGER